MGVAFVAHCLLNQNSRVYDGAHCAGVYSPIVDVLRARGWRIEQMPCPELTFAGLNRFWAVREQYDTAAFRRHCQRLATAVAGAIAARVQQGEEIVLVGVEGSPSMGVTITSSDPDRGGRPAWPDGSPELTGGEGIFVEELHAELGRRGITFRVAGERQAIPALRNWRIFGPPGTGELRGVELGIAETGAGQIRAGEVRTSEVRDEEMRTAKVRAAEVRAAEVRTVEVGAAKVRTTEERQNEVRTTEAGADEICLVEPRSDEVRASEVNGLYVALRISPPDHGDGGLNVGARWPFLRAGGMISRRPRLA